MRDLSRLLSPRRIAVIGGGAWCEAIFGAAERLGFAGDMIPVHPTGRVMAGRPSVPTLDQAGPIDAAFIGINRDATSGVTAQLAASGAGGAVCFASGFAEDGDRHRQDQLIAAAGDMPILGPNCYGFVNALDGVALWPDQHGCMPVDRGVAILTQSSNIAINLTMQRRGLPIGMVVACGNQAQTTQTDLARHLLTDPRITAIGLHVEGFGDLRGWEGLAAEAEAAGKPLISLKTGRSAQAQAAAISHTASLAGGDAGADALLARLGIARVHTLPGFLEALKLAHFGGWPSSNRIASISCSGGEAAVAGDLSVDHRLAFPPLTEPQHQALATALGPKVTLANPLDYHTYIWRDTAAMTAAWAAMWHDDLARVLVVLDYPRADRGDPSDWDHATEAVIAAQRATGGRYAVVSTLPELLPEAVADQLHQAGVPALCGLDAAAEGLAALAARRPPSDDPVLTPHPPCEAQALDEAVAKALLATTGVPVPKGRVLGARERAPDNLPYPVAAKVLGLAHKTGGNGLTLHLTDAAAVEAARTALAPGPLLVEEMITEPAVELLLSVLHDPAHGFVLTLGAGGTLTELWQDTAQLLLPVSRAAVDQALASLRIAPRFDGYRGAPAIDRDALWALIEAVQTLVAARAAQLEELELNPVLCTPTRAVAVDALIRLADTDQPNPQNLKEQS